MTAAIMTGDCVAIYARYDQKDICRSITNRRWNPDKKRWEVPMSSAAEVILKFPDADIDPEVFAAADALKRINSLSHRSSGQ
ncbi:MAG: hypothetical protein Q7J35_03505, partial [Candidatus Methanoperedens sp.]|nr:hypothetical protein [Candidatus Methanoperedens sp.]